MVKKIFKTIGKIGSFALIFILIVLITLYLTVQIFVNGPSSSARELFVTTILETGQLKFLASLVLNEQQINEIVSKNSLKDLDSEINTELIDIPVSNFNTNKELIEVHEIVGNNFAGKMMVVNDPSKISIATTYPWGEYGEELDKIVKKNNAIAGVNGGLYVSSGNKGGKPLGITVSNGEIQDISLGYKGLYMIGFDRDNILRILNIDGKNKKEIEELVKKENIRDAIAFQEEASDKNNHFVKLIINGEKRELNGLGSGANPRTAIGQRKDGSVLFLVTDGRGKNGHLGATASDLIEIMEKYGAVNAANLDGGSSSTMYYKDEYLMTSVTFYYTNSSWKLPTAFIIKEESAS